MPLHVCAATWPRLEGLRAARSRAGCSPTAQGSTGRQRCGIPHRGHAGVKLQRFRKQLPTSTEENPPLALNTRASMPGQETPGNPELKLPKRKQYLGKALDQTLALTKTLSFLGQPGVRHSWIRSAEQN